MESETRPGCLWHGWLPHLEQAHVEVLLTQLLERDLAGHGLIHDAACGENTSANEWPQAAQGTDRGLPNRLCIAVVCHEPADRMCVLHWEVCARAFRDWRQAVTVSRSQARLLQDGSHGGDSGSVFGFGYRDVDGWLNCTHPVR